MTETIQVLRIKRPRSRSEEAHYRVVVPAIESFKPELIGVSAGYDAHYTDPVGNMNVDSRTFWLLGNTVEKLVRNLGLQGSFWVLEGGYNPFALGPSIRASLDGLLGGPVPDLEDQTEREEHEMLIDSNNQVIEQVLETHSKYL